MISEQQLTELFCNIDDFCQIFEYEYNTKAIGSGKKKRNRKTKLSQSEMITIMIAFHLSDFKTFKHFYLDYVCVHWKKHFPDVLSYNRFVELQPRCAPAMMMYLKLCGFGKCTGITFVDSSPIRVCKNQRIHSHKVFKDLAQRGKSSMGWFYGFKLHLVINDKGEVLNFAVTKGNVHDANPKVVKELAKDLFGKMYGDRGYISKKLFEALFNEGVHLITKIRRNMKNVLMTLKDKITLRKRSVIESVNDELKNICQIEHSRHRSPANFIMNTMGALCAYNLLPKKPSIKVEYQKTNQLSFLI